MAKFCIRPENVEKFKKGLTDGSINPDKLSNMTSDERRKYLSDYVGETISKKVNAEFESKLLLKNQKAGMIKWAEGVAGLNKETRRDIIGRISRLESVLDPQNKEMFLSDIAERRLGIGVSADQAKTIMDLSRKVSDLEGRRLPTGAFANDADRMAYGRAVFDMTDFVNDIRSKAKSMSLEDLKKTPVQFGGKLVETTAANAKAINASMDNSSIFRPGFKLMWSKPKIWLKNATESFSNIAKSLGGKNVKREVTADIVSRPNYSIYKKMGLAVGNLEEAFPTTMPEKLPLLGRLYKASEDAYTGFIQRSRADAADYYLNVAKNVGVNIDDPKELKAIGGLVNSLTGRGDLGRLERAGEITNVLFFSPKYLKSNIDTILHPLTAKSGFARKEAAKNLVKIVAGTAAVLKLAEMLAPGSVEWNPRSSDFGKIRIGNTRFDITGGTGSIATLAARIASQESKSATTGIISKMGTEEWGSDTSWDVFTRFAENKTSPFAGLIMDMWKGKDFEGNKVTAGSAAWDLFTPLSVKTYAELSSDSNSPNVLASLILDGLGIGANTYSPVGDRRNPSWTKSTSNEIKEFSKAVGKDKFMDAAKKYDVAYNTWIASAMANPDYKKMSNDDKLRLITAEKNQLKKDIFAQYNFRYKAPRKPTLDKSLLKGL